VHIVSKYYIIETIENEENDKFVFLPETLRISKCILYIHVKKCFYTKIFRACSSSSCTLFRSSARLCPFYLCIYI